MLKIQNQKVITCIYTYIIGKKEFADNFNNDVILHRRIYKLINNTKLPYLIVHYRKPTVKSQRTSFL